MQKPKTWKAEEIIGLVSDELLDSLADQTRVDYSVKTLQGQTIFKLFLFAALNGGAISLSILETIFQSERFKSLFSIQTKSASRAAFSFRLKNIRTDYFENIFKHLICPEARTALKLFVMSLTMIAASPLTLYKQLNQIMGWTVAKIRFLDELYVEITGGWRSEIALAFHPINLNSS